MEYLLSVTSSIGEKIKKSSEISECFKIMGSQLSFFPYAIRGSMHEVGEFHNQPLSNLHPHWEEGLNDKWVDGNHSLPLVIPNI